MHSYAGINEHSFCSPITRRLKVNVGLHAAITRVFLFFIVRGRSGGSRRNNSLAQFSLNFDHSWHLYAKTEVEFKPRSLDQINSAESFGLAQFWRTSKVCIKIMQTPVHLQEASIKNFSVVPTISLQQIMSKNILIIH
jgi:hypothetical protein